MSADQPVDFGAELARLEDIVRRLEGEDLDLDEALRLFEDGVERLRRAREHLSAAEVRVGLVVVGGGGGVRALPLDD
jgi:exodeoxyribonuclease VII small subunit